MFQKKKWFVTGMALALSLGLAACTPKGADGSDFDSKSGKAAVEEIVPEFTYVAKFSSLSEDMGNLENVVICGEYAYAMKYDYNNETNSDSSSIVKYKFNNGKFENPEKVLGFGNNGYALSYCVDEAGNLYYVSRISPEAPGEGATEEQMNAYYESLDQNSKYHLVKIDAQGNQIYDVDFTNETKKNDYFYTNQIVADEKGRVFASVGGESIWTFDENGNKSGEISVSQNGYINSMGTGKDQKCYVSYVQYGGEGATTTFAELDYDGKKLGKSYANYPSNRGSSSFTKGIESDILCYDGIGVYEYSMEKEEAQKLLSWLDCDVNGDQVTAVIPSGDGKIYAITRDWNANESNLIELSKMKTEDVIKRETVKVGTIYQNNSLNSKIIEFNKNNDKYRITVKAYMDENDWSEKSYQDAIANLTNDILSGNGPDILDLSNLDVNNLAKKGVLEDLMPYLEKSTRLNKNDFFERILDVATINGSLVYLPSTFTLSTLAAKTSLVGDKMGWTLEDMMKLQEAYPKAELLQGATKDLIMQMMLMLDKEAFIDVEKNECHFDSQQFKNLLKFANKFPKEYDYSNGYQLPPLLLKDNRLLLSNADIYSFEEVQSTLAYFSGEQVTFIGYPNSKGGNGCIMMPNEQYGINAKSAHKDAAWAFLEDVIDSETDDNGYFGFGFSTMKSRYEKQKAKALDVKPMTDENGEVITDENGNPVYEGVGGGYTMVGDNGEEWNYVYKPVTEEDCAIVEKLLAGATVVDVNMDEELGKIITEEAQAYFDGAKSLDDVANVIQNRANLYLKENN